MNNAELLMEDFQSEKVFLQQLAIKSKTFIEQCLLKQNIKYHQIVCRVKTYESLKEKVLSKDKYSHLSEITDLVGIRIITYYEDQIDKIAEVLKENFKVDKENSVDKREISSENKTGTQNEFGYKSLHIVGAIRNWHLKKVEDKQFIGRKVEIQIRSILQHTWAEMHHDLGYKEEVPVPEHLKRGFSRLAAVLEIADLEFIRLRDSILGYEKDVRERILVEPLSVQLEPISLRIYTKYNEEITSIKKKMSNVPDYHEDDDDTVQYIYLMKLLAYFGVKTAKHLNSLFNYFEKKIPLFYRLLLTRRGLPSLDHGVPISSPVLLICYMLSVHTVEWNGKGNIIDMVPLNWDEHVKFCKRFFVNDTNNLLRDAIFDSAKEVIKLH